MVTATFTLQIASWLLACYVFISLLEYLVNRHLMHSRRLPKWLYAKLPSLLEAFEAHAIRHHVKWYRQFDFEPDELGREDNIRFGWKTTLVLTVATLPVWLPLFFVSTAGGMLMMVSPLVHSKVHNLLHHEMHVPKWRLVQENRLYQALARYHFLHHQHSNRNYNLSFPLFDLLLGTRATPTWGDVRAMVKIGLLRVRKLKSQRQLLAKSNSGFTPDADHE